MDVRLRLHGNCSVSLARHIQRSDIEDGGGPDPA